MKNDTMPKSIEQLVADFEKFDNIYYRIKDFLFGIFVYRKTTLSLEGLEELQNH